MCKLVDDDAVIKNHLAVEYHPESAHSSAAGLSA